MNNRYQGKRIIRRITRITGNQNYKRTFFKTTNPISSINQYVHWGKWGEAKVLYKIKTLQKHESQM